MALIKLIYIAVNLIKEVKDLYSEKCKILMKEIEDDTNKWKVIHFHGLEKLILLKCPYYPKQAIGLLQSLSKYP